MAFRDPGRPLTKHEKSKPNPPDPDGDEVATENDPAHPVGAVLTSLRPARILVEQSPLRTRPKVLLLPLKCLKCHRCGRVWSNCYMDAAGRHRHIGGQSTIMGGTDPCDLETFCGWQRSAIRARQQLSPRNTGSVSPITTRPRTGSLIFCSTPEYKKATASPPRCSIRLNTASSISATRVLAACWSIYRPCMPVRRSPASSNARGPAFWSSTWRSKTKSRRCATAWCRSKN